MSQNPAFMETTASSDDRAEPSQVRVYRPRTAPALIVGGLVGVLVLVVAPIWLEPSLRSLPPGTAFKIGLLAIGLAGLYCVLVVHECGHLLAGWLVGFRFQLFTLGPLRVQRDESGRIRPGLNRDLAMYGGAALALPTDGRDLRWRYAWFAAGGPLMSFALAARLLVLPVIARARSGRSVGWGCSGSGSYRRPSAWSLPSQQQWARSFRTECGSFDSSKAAPWPSAMLHWSTDGAGRCQYPPA